MIFFDFRRPPFEGLLFTNDLLLFRKTPSRPYDERRLKGEKNSRGDERRLKGEKNSRGDERRLKDEKNSRGEFLAKKLSSYAAKQFLAKKLSSCAAKPSPSALEKESFVSQAA